MLIFNTDELFHFFFIKFLVEVHGFEGTGYIVSTYGFMV